MPRGWPRTRARILARDRYLPPVRGRARPPRSTTCAGRGSRTTPGCSASARRATRPSPARRPQRAAGCNGARARPRRREAACRREPGMTAKGRQAAACQADRRPHARRGRDPLAGAVVAALLPPRDRGQVRPKKSEWLTFRHSDPDGRAGRAGLARPTLTVCRTSPLPRGTTPRRMSTSAVSARPGAAVRPWSCCGSCEAAAGYAAGQLGERRSARSRRGEAALELAAELELAAVSLRRAVRLARPSGGRWPASWPRGACRRGRSPRGSACPTGRCGPTCAAGDRAARESGCSSLPD